MEMKPVSSMHIWAHVEELRRVAIACVLVLLGCCLLVGFFLPQVAQWLMQPLHTALEGQPHLLQGLITTSPMGIFSVLLQVCFLGGIGLSLPAILFLIGRFIAPALTPKEIRYLFPSACSAFTLCDRG